MTVHGRFLFCAESRMQMLSLCPLENVCLPGHFEPPFPHPLLHLRIDLLGPLGRTNLHDLSLLLEVIHDGHARFDKGPEPLLDALGVVICPSRRLAPFDQTFLQQVFGAIEEEGEFGGADRLFKLECLIHLAGEACSHCQHQPLHFVHRVTGPYRQSETS